jgi:hypothetical protein
MRIETVCQAHKVLNRIISPQRKVSCILYCEVQGLGEEIILLKTCISFVAMLGIVVGANSQIIITYLLHLVKECAG